MKIMENTIFDVTVLKYLIKWLSMAALRIAGWQVEGKAPDLKKYVMIAAPHTSNWDFVLTLMMAFILDIKIYLMGKKELVDWRLGFVLMWLGIIPVDRSGAHDIVSQMVSVFKKNEKLVVLIPPSGTRKRVSKWKTGFYHIAYNAEVPILFGYLDYGRKVGGIGPLYIPTGDIERDMVEIRSFYAGIAGKYPEKVLNSSKLPTS